MCLQGVHPQPVQSLRDLATGSHPKAAAAAEADELATNGADGQHASSAAPASWQLQPWAHAKPRPDAYVSLRLAVSDMSAGFPTFRLN